MTSQEDPRPNQRWSDNCHFCAHSAWNGPESNPMRARVCEVSRPATTVLVSHTCDKWRSEAHQPQPESESDEE